MIIIKYKHFNSTEEFEKWQFQFQGKRKLVIHNIYPVAGMLNGFQFLFIKIKYQTTIFVTYHEEISDEIL